MATLDTAIQSGGAQTLYAADGAYERLHPDWHAADGPGKALDIWQGIEDAIERAVAAGRDGFSFCDVGCGAGAVAQAIVERLANSRPDLAVRGVGVDVAPYPIEHARTLHPGLDLRVADLRQMDERFDAILFCDVLEHLENPFELMRKAAEMAPVMIVRQPLQGDLGMFRKRLFESAIADLGHIQFFNMHGFTAIARTAGWTPSRLSLAAPWELNVEIGWRPNPLKAALTRANRELASFLTSGFYLNGSFVRAG